MKNKTKRRTKSSLKPVIWRTQDGRSVPISRMSNSHLINAFRFQRKVMETIRQESLDLTFVDNSDDQADFYRHLNREIGNQVRYDALRAEIKKRGLSTAKPAPIPPKVAARLDKFKASRGW